MIDIGKNEFRCLFVRVIGTLQPSLVTYKYRTVTHNVKFSITWTHNSQTHETEKKLFENKNEIQKKKSPFCIENNILMVFNY